MSSQIAQPAGVSPSCNLAHLAPLLLALLFVISGCQDAARGPDEPATGGSPALGSEARAVSLGNDRTEPKKPRVLFLGTSLTAGFGLSKEEAFPALVGEHFEAKGLLIEVVNAGVSGDTSAGGLSRLDWLLLVPPDIIVVELGANDGLRGLPVDMTEANLREVIRRAANVGARTIVAGMQMPPNYGDDYTREFAALFPRVAQESGSVLVPFLLEGVAGDPALNLIDGIHPNPDGHEQIARVLLPYVEAAIAELVPG